MQYRNNKIRSSRARILVETILAMVVMAIIFKQFRMTQNSWDTNMGASETLQNSRVLIDQLNRNLPKDSRITAVSDLSEANGNIEFLDNDANKEI